jgi:3-hydroxyacyl-CoA dehydrogenase
MHFFSPANIMKLVEVVRGKRTAPDVLATVVGVAKKIGKLPVVVGNCHGFVGNRMLARRSEQVDRLLLEGALPEEIDAALTGFGFKLGPCAMGDLAGLDISWRMRRATGRTAPVADALVEAGRLGQKSGSGYYAYGEDRRTPISDPAVRTLIEAVSAANGITRRDIDAGEALDRMVLPMVNEGARILEEGIAARPDDIDTIWLHGYGFPRHRGGPMFYARQRGFANAVSRLEALARATGDESLKPVPYLVKFAEEEASPR